MSNMKDPKKKKIIIKNCEKKILNLQQEYYQFFQNEKISKINLVILTKHLGQSCQGSSSSRVLQMNQSAGINCANPVFSLHAEVTKSMMVHAEVMKSMVHTFSKACNPG